MSHKNDFQVLAKSEPEMTLQHHIEDCLNIFSELKLCFHNLPLAGADCFWKSVYTAVVIHDLGKAHPDFQALLRKMKNAWHMQRHELFSVCFTEQMKMADVEKRLIAFAVAGHHKSLNELADYVRKNYKSSQRNELWDDFEDDEEKKEFINEFGKIDQEYVNALLSFYGIDFKEKDKFEYGIIEQIRNLKKFRSVAESSMFLNQLLLVGALKQCDHLASAGIKALGKLELRDFDFLYSHALYIHQQEASEAIGHVILSAPTGSGKTETALLWLKKQLHENGQGRVFYVLPFTASINAMYERLDGNFSKDERKVGMQHGKLAQYLEYRLSEDDEILDETEKRQLLEDFKSLVTPLKVVTPFQLLKHLFGLRGFEKGMFEWCGCYLIFDEIHAYDPKVFAQVVVLLKFMIGYMKANVHIMTATLPGFMRRELEVVLGTCTEIHATRELYEKFDRHRVRLQSGKLIDSLNDIQNRLDQGQHVLVVCNTVAMAQQVFKKLEAEKKVLLHGAFNGADRYGQEKRLRCEEIDLLVGTQAIEVSLDIDYDCIYTEPAPLDALIQRFGRVNRKRAKGICDCCIFEERNDTDHFIYQDAQVIERTLAVLREIECENDGIIKEYFLQQAIDYVYPDWNEKNREEYNNVMNFLEYDVIHCLSPLEYSEQREEEFTRQFNGIQVLPVSLKGLFQDFLDMNQFIKAESLLVNVSEKRFVALLKQGQLIKEKFAFESGKTGKVYEKDVYVINRKYSHELGLLINEDETENVDSCIL